MIKKCAKESTREKREDAVADKKSKTSIKERKFRQGKTKDGSSAKHTDLKSHWNGGIIARMNNQPERRKANRTLVNHTCIESKVEESAKAQKLVPTMTNNGPR